MTKPILHHYGLSPFSEKVRLALGLKGVPWGSVDIPVAPPRPLLVPLTGGYRRTPVLQVGADIYCDTTIILPAIERLHPAPSLYPKGSRGFAEALSFAWERLAWIPAIGVLVHFIGNLPSDFIKDRKEGYLYIDISKDAMEPELPQNVQRLQAQLAWLKAALADGRHDPGLPFEVRGPAGVLQLHDALMPAFPDMRLPLEDFVAEGEKVLVRLRVQATHTGAFGEMQATGRKIDIAVLDLFQIRDGRLIEHWALLDNLGMLKQLGAA